MGAKRVVCLTLVLLLPLLGGCAIGTTGPLAAPSTDAAAVSTVASATAAATPTPSTTPIASPTAADATASAAAAEEPLRYYVVEQDEHQGVVDSLGREVLPCSFASVEILADSAGEGSGQYTGSVVFFAVPVVLLPAGGGSEQAAGFLYDTAGQKLSEEPFTWANRLEPDRIVVSRVDDSGTYVVGMVDSTGRELLPNRYQYITQYADGYLALTSETNAQAASATLFDGALTEVATAKGSFDCYDGKLILKSSPQKTWQVVDERLQPVDESQWESIWQIGEDRYVAADSAQRQSIINHTGKVLVAPIDGYYGVYAKDKGGEFYTVNYANGGVGLLDGDGKTLYQSAKYSQIWYGDGAIVAYDEVARIGTAVDLQGKVLVPEVSQVIGWDASAKLLMSKNDKASPASMTFYRLDGHQFSIERASYIYRLTDNRFLVYMEATEENGYNSLMGMTDDDGNWILPPVYEWLDQIGDGLLAAGQRDAKGLLLCGLVDLDGKVALPAKYDSLQSTYEGSLLHARVSTRYGLIDRKGNWVWSASDYSSLVD